MRKDAEASVANYASIAVLVALILLFGVSPFLSGARLWGMNHVLFLSFWQTAALAAVGLALVVGFFVLIRAGRRVPVDSPIRIRGSHLLIAAVASSVVFYLLQPHYPFLGDGVLRSSEITFGKLFSKAEPLDTFFHALLFRIANGLVDFSATAAYRVLSSVSGGLAVAYFLNYFSERGCRGFWAAAYAVTLGSTALLCGYVESYSIGYTAALVYLLSTEKFLRAGEGIVLPAVSLALAVTSHIANLVLLPSFAVPLLSWVRGEKSRAEMFIVPAAVSIAVAVPAYFALLYQGWEGVMPGDPFVPVALSYGYSLLSTDHILDILNQFAFVMPAGLVLFWQSLRGVRQLSDSSRPVFWFLILVSLSSLFFLFIIDPKLGFARDWDLFATATASLAIVILIARLARDIAFRWFEKAAVLLSFLMLGSFVVVNMGMHSSVKRFSHLLDLDSERSPFGREILSNYCQSRGDYDSAILHLRLALEIEDNKRHHILLSTMLSELGRHRESLNEALRAVALDGEYAPSHYQLGRSADRAGNIELARQSYENAVSLRPDAASYRNALGAAYLNLGDYGNAERMFASAAELEPKNTTYLNNLGSSKMALGKLREAVSCFERVLSYDPLFVESMFNLARVYAALGMNDKAESQFRMFLRYGTDSTLLRQAEVLLDSLR